MLLYSKHFNAFPSSSGSTSNSSAPHTALHDLVLLVSLVSSLSIYPSGPTQPGTQGQLTILVFRGPRSPTQLGGTLSLEHTLSLPGYISTFQVSRRPSLPLQSALLSVSGLHPAAFPDTPTVLCSHLSGLTVLDSNHPPPQLGAKLLEGRAVSVFSAFTHPQRLQGRRTFVSKSKKGRIPRTEEGTAEPPTLAIRARREDGSARRSVSVT